ncbi:restriction endonuclease subunit S [Klebsiella quasipneumoniae]|uniref:Restriction endonuclease subunit S n=3 Tax=Klebsiella quasipneumoniae TaxID=1463165 RepID=A0A8I0DH60_9ENTR|nr:restriction endonuclease subunit S [Klebsiella quasipneumoniae]MBC4807469.1 restriction endonuclease subunit S [Klebsiella quasipneumoniae]MBC5048893.1 restriction endonuclease subunit S [Klebsiella quasipneumoniae]MCF1311062.1 restriction endonuclease subunit S [Klebsiella quasipneumoniae]MCJ3090946.1 restriction endonuclease subunit S [Klebsiella quasipneumoniae]MCJ5247799.1 restriction endonuclease subunit S [Klebsiella quasipneumoniae]
MDNFVSMPKYETYRNSNIQWIGEIPTKWNLKKAKWLFYKVERKPLVNDEIVTCFRDGQVTLRKNRRIEGFTNALKEHGYQRICKGDLVIHAMDAFAGAIGVSDSDGKSTPVYAACIPRKKGTINSYYYAYYMRNLALSGFIESLAKGIRERSTDFRFNDFAELVLPFPNYKEQTLIANFLDIKTSQIDETISIKQQQINLLKERKKIIIQKAVTQGLNPNVPMRNSGVDWIGKFPEHWQLKRLKYVTKIVKRIIGYEGPDVLSITKKGIKIKDIESGEGQLAMDYSKYQIVKIGDFAMNHMDLLTGYVDISKHEGVVSPDYRVFINTFDGLEDEFLLSIFQLGYQQKIFYRYGQGVSFLGRWRFPAESFNNFYIPIPPNDEQISIVKHVKAEWDKLDKAIDLLASQIGKMKEYKTALIDSAVTGKIKIVPEMMEQ